MATPATPVQFRDGTLRAFVNTGVLSFNNFSQTQTIQLPALGFLGGVLLYVTGTLTTGSGTVSGSLASYPPSPYNLIQNIRVYTSENITLRSLSAWGLYLYNLLLADNFAGDQVQQAGSTSPTVVNYNPNGRANMFISVPTTVAAATAYPFAFGMYVPIKTDEAHMWSMILLQNNQIRVLVDITTANQSQVQGTLSGVSLTLAANVAVATEIFEIPADGSLPELRYVQRILEEFFPFTTTGDIIYRPVTGDIWLSVLGIVENAGQNVAPFNTASGSAPTTQLNYVKWTYAQTVTPTYLTWPLMLLECKRELGFYPPDGCFVLDWMNGIGVPPIIDTRDWVNTSQQTDFQIVVNHSIPANQLSGAQIRFVKNLLSEVM